MQNSLHHGDLNIIYHHSATNYMSESTSEGYKK